MKKAFLKWIMAVLGVTSVSSCFLYASPHATYEAKGCVTDDEGRSITGIQVGFCASYGETDSLGNKIYYPDGQPVLTDTDGKFSLKVENYGFGGGESVTISFIDIDGPDGGGSFQSKFVEQPLVQKKKGKWHDSWDEGDYEVPGMVNVTLEREPQE